MLAKTQVFERKKVGKQCTQIRSNRHKIAGRPAIWGPRDFQLNQYCCLHQVTFHYLDFFLLNQACLKEDSFIILFGTLKIKCKKKKNFENESLQKIFLKPLKILIQELTNNSSSILITEQFIEIKPLIQVEPKGDGFFFRIKSSKIPIERIKRRFERLIYIEKIISYENLIFEIVEKSIIFSFLKLNI
jgi:hypothetical protein